MKTYVFMTRHITGIDGAEQYIYNKLNYLKGKGWRVIIFSGQYGHILIDKFKEYEKYIYPHLICCPNCFTKKEVFEIVDKIILDIGKCNGNKCIIESESVTRAIWAELIAQKLQCKHLAFLLQEKHDYMPETIRFLRFKYYRHELAGIAKQSINQMMNDDTIERRDDTKIQAFCNNVIEDVADRFSSDLNQKATFTIGSIGRLSKPCVLPLLEGIKRFILSYPNIIFNLILIGGQGRRKRIREIEAMFNKIPNVTLILTGNVYPIPKSLIQRIDVFVSTAGASTASYRSGRPTVRVHPLTGEPVGIPGLDFDLMEKSMYDVTPGMTIENCLKRVLINKEKIEYNYLIDNMYIQDMENEFDRQISISFYKSEKKYYDIDKLLLLNIKMRTLFVHKIFGRILGGYRLNKITKFIEKQN